LTAQNLKSDKGAAAIPINIGDYYPQPWIVCPLQLIAQSNS
jgi:hypothetical protein